MTSWIHLQPWTREMPEEALRYEALSDLRQFIRDHYTIVSTPRPHPYPPLIVLKRIDSSFNNADEQK